MADQYDRDLASAVGCLLLRNPVSFDNAARELFDQHMLDEPTHVKLLFEMALQLRENPELRHAPSYDMLSMEYEALTREKKTPAKIAENGFLFLDEVFTTRMHEDAQDYLHKAAEKEWKLRSIRAVRQELQSSDLLDREVVNQQEAILSRDLFKKPPVVDIAANIEHRLHMTRRVSTGIDFLDHILDGGTLDGELHGYLAPSGGGKTTLALQLMRGSVLNKRGHVHVTVEQPPDGDIALRAACLMADLPRKAFLDPDNLSVETRRALENSRKAWSSCTRVIDMSRSREITIPALMGLVDQSSREMGTPAKVFSLDWWGKLSDRMQGSVGAKISPSEIRMKNREWMDDLRISLDERGMVGHVFHQLSGEASAKGPKHRASSHDAQEDKNFNNLFDFCWVFGKMTAGKVCRLNSDKARSTAGAECVLKLEGDNCRFRRANETEIPAELGPRPGYAEQDGLDPDDAYAM